MVLYTHPRIVKLMGGKQAMLDALKQGMAEMRDGGTTFSDATLGTPDEPKKFGSWITSVVPQHIVMKVPGGKLLRDSFLLGISEDAGNHWVFVDIGQMTAERFAQVFPELDGKITLPEKKEAVFKKDE